MSRPPPRLVLGSRSPRRLELLRQIWPAELIDVVPPTSSAEAQFDDLHDWPSIEGRLLEIATAKCDDVAAQVRNSLRGTARSADDEGKGPLTPSPSPARGEGGVIGGEPFSPSSSPFAPCGRGAGGEGSHDESTTPVVIAADTVVVVERAGGSLHVLGQPPADDSWPETVGRWFREDFAGKTHLAATAVCIERLDSTEAQTQTRRAVRVVTSRVTFIGNVDAWLDWYLATGEPRGKAGGYAIQGAGSIFISKVEGSLSNVVGLPLADVLEMLTNLAGIYILPRA
jgi:predicted house-cleaning NTP pyrophosphatase (Maf/HAM1 superfamily)